MRRPSASLVISLVALFLALTGVGFAAGEQLTGGLTLHFTVYGKSASLCGANAGCRTSANSAATCPKDTTLTGGGWVQGTAGYGFPTDATVSQSGPLMRGYNTWWVLMSDNSSSGHDGSFEAVAYCER